MREVAVEAVAAAFVEAIGRASFCLGDEEKAALARALDAETSPTGRAILAQILENAQVAQTECRPLCQDTGVAVLFVEVGEEVRLVAEDGENARPVQSGRAGARPLEGKLEKALQGAVREA